MMWSAPEVVGGEAEEQARGDGGLPVQTHLAKRVKPSPDNQREAQQVEQITRNKRIAREARQELDRSEQAGLYKREVVDLHGSRRTQRGIMRVPSGVIDGLVKTREKRDIAAHCI